MPPRTIKSTHFGKQELRLVSKDGRYFGLANGTICVEGTDDHDVWTRLVAECGKLGPRYYGYEGARQRFLRLFPAGFADAEFERRERADKLRQMQQVQALLPLAAAQTDPDTDTLASLVGLSDLLFSIEKIRVRELLRSPSGKDFLRSAAEFTADPSQVALKRLDAVLAPHGCANWSIATLLPFLWWPEAHMILKPEASKDFGARVGHPFATLYQSRLDFSVYESFLDMVRNVEAELVRLGPRDRLDAQSFIWIVGRYQEVG